MRVTFISYLILGGVVALPFSLVYGQVLTVNSSSPVEPGLEKAIKWKWSVLPSDSANWGLRLPALPKPTPTAVQVATPAPAIQFTEYTVRRGDALAKIAHRYNITLKQLKVYNNLTSNLIRVGDVLKIPSKAEAERVAPTPKVVVKSKRKKMPSQPTLNKDLLLLQVFLDREGFSAGPVTTTPNITFSKVRQLYQSATGSPAEISELLQLARERVGEATTKYTLKREDYAFISPPKARVTPSVADSGKRKTSSTASAGPTYEELLAEKMLAYRTPWEFIAERFHCDLPLLQALNPELKDVPRIGTTLVVPNVIPFEIENVFREVVQPTADSKNPVRAVLRDLSLLEIYHSDRLVAVMPVSMARPGLRGRGSWIIQKAIPRPRLATRQESRVTRVYKPSPFGYRNPNPTPAPTPFRLTSRQFLQAGPNNPVGIFWVDLAKSDDPEPLPYGLHGTSNPDKMRTRQSLGGIRLSNWDIVRAVRLLPEGTEMEWRVSEPFTPRVPAASRRVEE